jgi:flavin-dependent dehydrogenase
VLDRLAFERQLTERALAAGADPVAAQVTGCTRDGTGWQIALSDGTRCADYVIDATGRSAVLARQHAQRFRADQLAVLYAFPDQDPASDVGPTQATLIEAVPDGWWYAAYLPGGRLALNYYTDVDLVPEGAARDPATGLALLAQTRHVSRWVAEAGFRFGGSLTLGSAATLWLAPCAGQGWLAAGDAAAAFDPLSSHGMTTALWCGAQAAEVALADIGGDPGPARRYAEAVANGVQEFLQARARIYRMEPRFAGTDFWQRRRAESGEKWGNIIP